MLILLRVISAFVFILDSLITFFLVVVFARVVLSWIRIPYNPIVQLIYQVTEPVLRPIRRRMPLTWGIDFSPMIILLALWVIRIVVVGGISDYVAIYRDQYIRSIAG
ncbi:MAG TPA: YggT family protein [Acidobacteriota bacterium]|nr:YggT family protein [Acidobacteriota bacterium]